MTTFAPPEGMTVHHFDVLKDIPEGPWSGEPDKAQWVDEATGLDCLIVRGPLGALCGYVGIPFEHKLHGLDFMDLEQVAPSVSVAHGVNYSDLCNEDESGPVERGWPAEYRICHTPQPGRPGNVWWFGFENSLILYDITPLHDHTMAEIEKTTPIFAGMPRPPVPWPERSYKTFEYVREQCAALAEQLVALA